jgi:hypothetical protein
MNASQAREQLDRLFSFDAAFSVVFGTLSLVAPHGILSKLAGGSYNHSVHETLRYVCMLKSHTKYTEMLTRNLSVCMVVSGWLVVGFYGMPELLMMGAFANTFAKLSLFVILFKHWQSCELSLLNFHL